MLQQSPGTYVGEEPCCRERVYLRERMLPGQGLRKVELGWKEEVGVQE